MCDKKLQCKICGKRAANMSGLGLHIRVHSISTKDYYTKILGNPIGKCLECGKEPTFASLGVGFKRFCLRSCGTKWLWKHGDNTERIKKIVKSNRVNPRIRANSKESNEKRSKALKGRTYVDLFGVEGAKIERKKKSLSLSGDKNWQWKGGTSTEPYPYEFYYTREKIKERDGHICQRCEKTEIEEKEDLNRGLAVHHIDYNKDNNGEDNLITLCCRCNTQVN